MTRNIMGGNEKMKLVKDHAYTVTVPEESKVMTCKADSSLLYVSDIMVQLNIGCLMVINDERNVVGIITERDMVKAMKYGGYHGKHSAEMLAGDYMTGIGKL